MKLLQYKLFSKNNIQIQIKTYNKNIEKEKSYKTS